MSLRSLRLGRVGLDVGFGLFRLGGLDLFGGLRLVIGGKDQAAALTGLRRHGSQNESGYQDQFAHVKSPLFDGRRLNRRRIPLCDADHAAKGMTMNKGALALLVHGGTENWSPQRWKTRFDDVFRDRRVVLLPDAAFDPSGVHYAAVWKPYPGDLAAFPNLRVIFNLGAGVDALMADASLPKVPLVRIAVSDLTFRMTEYVVLHVLMHHRQELYLRQSQREKRWAPRSQWAAGALTVGIMGLGPLGAHAADVLRLMGFRLV